MADQYLEVPGLIVAPGDLKIPRALAVANLLVSGALPFARLVECHRQEGGTEHVAFDIEPERGQIRKIDIHRVERISVEFKERDDAAPEVWALRSDFPRAPHQNLRQSEFPRNLCLDDRTWDEARLRWAAAPFIERVRYWLSQTSKGSLHHDDQPLEQLIFGTGYRLILPSDLFASGQPTPELLDVTFAGGEDKQVVIARRPGDKRDGLPFLATTLRCPPQRHGLIRHTPKNLKELHDFLAPANVDLYAILRERLMAWRTKELLPARVIIVIAFPKQRGEAEVVETTDIWAFFTFKEVAELGKELGCWAIQDNRVCPLVGGGSEENDEGHTVEVFAMTPHYAFCRDTAAQMNGFPSADNRVGVVVGAGALGSQVLTNLARSAFGKWAVIDEDCLLPHNLARHALDGFFVGQPKARSVGMYLNMFFEQREEERFVTSAIEADVLHPLKHKELVEKAMQNASVILDMSASVPVARYLAIDAKSDARRVSLFFNPVGTDLVLIAEDAKRTLALDALEMQYYRAVSRRPDLASHLKREATRVRYGRSCRDLSTRIPQDRVALLSAIGSAAVRIALESQSASIRIWHCDENFEVTRSEIKPTKTISNRFGEWTLVTDQALIQKIAGLRRQKLPNETGGVLLGSIDLLRRIVYVVDTIPSPPDSKEWPTLYIRGHEKLPDMVKGVRDRTAGNLEYVGEWHSHPTGCTARPSNDDMKVFAWLTQLMDVDGLPALMLIMAEREYMFYLGRMERI